MEYLSTVASVAGTVMLARSVCKEYLPDEILQYFSRLCKYVGSRFWTELWMVIEEHDSLVKNQIYEAAEIYLGNKISSSTRTLRVTKPDKEKKIKVSMGRDEEIVDIFNGIEFKWISVCQKVDRQTIQNVSELDKSARSFNYRSESRSFWLSFPNKYKDFVLDTYLPYIEKQAMLIKEESKAVKIFTINDSGLYDDCAEKWKSVNLDHPSTFDKLAMDPELKNSILQDLDMFVRRREYYREVGKAWKRGYLLYGPPGTGKSSLIAAMANYLNFDIYDLELSSLQRNSELRQVLLETSSRSILVVEDIDCTIHLQDRSNPNGAKPKEHTITLSGFLNFIDGLWSSCGDERIIVFTTNYKEKLDPALLRPGRMDFHIHMSYCTPSGFKVLANNYLNIKDHILFEEIEKLIQIAEVTPAEVAERLMRHEDPDVSLKSLIEFLNVKFKENQEAKAKKIDQQSSKQTTQSVRDEEESESEDDDGE